MRIEERWYCGIGEVCVRRRTENRDDIEDGSKPCACKYKLMGG